MGISGARISNVTLNSSGYGFCTVYAPDGVQWKVTLVSVSTSVVQSVTAPPVQPICNIYRDSSPTPTHFVELTYNGNRAGSDTVYDVNGGEPITAEWIGGTAGSVATLRVQFTQTERGR